MRIESDGKEPISAQTSKQHVLKIHPKLQLSPPIEPSKHDYTLGTASPKCVKVAQSTLQGK